MDLPPSIVTKIVLFCELPDLLNARVCSKYFFCITHNALVQRETTAKKFIVGRRCFLCKTKYQLKNQHVTREKYLHPCRTSYKTSWIYEEFLLEHTVFPLSIFNESSYKFCSCLLSWELKRKTPFYK